MPTRVNYKPEKSIQHLVVSGKDLWKSNAIHILNSQEGDKVSIQEDL